MTQATRPYWVHSDPNISQQQAVYALCLLCAEGHTVGSSYLCGRCFGRLRRNVAILVGVHGWLGVAMYTPAPTRRDGPGRSAPGSRPPFNPALHDLRVDITGKLRSWSRLIAEEHQLRGPADGDVRTVAGWMKEQLPWVSDQRWCSEMAAALGESVQDARKLVPWERVCRPLPLPCPGRYGCNLLTLCVYGGDDAVTCRNPECGRLINWDDYWACVVEQHRAAKALASQATPLTITGAAA